VTGGPKVFPADTDLEYTVTQSNSNLPEFLVVKDSWPLSDRATEGKMFKEVEGQFGVPDVLGSYQVKNSEASEEDATAALLPEDAVKWGGWGVVHEKPEHRIHMRIIIRTQGRSLMEAKGPKELLLGVLHAMIGQSALTSDLFTLFLTLFRRSLESSEGWMVASRCKYWECLAHA